MADENIDALAAAGVASYLKGTYPSPDVPVKANLVNAVQQDPDEVARWRNIASKIGVPEESAKFMGEWSKTQAVMKDINIDNVMRLNPLTAGILADSVKAPIAHDDVGVLKSIENALRKFNDGGALKPYAGDIGRFALESGKQLAFGATAGLGAGIFDAAAVPLDFASLATQGLLPQDIPGALAANYRNMAQRARASMNYYSDKSTSNIAAGIQSGFRSAGQNLALLPLGVAGGAEAMLASMSGMVGAQAFTEARDRGMGQIGAATYAIPHAAFEYAFEKLPAHLLVNDIAKHANLMQIIGHQLVPEVLGEQATTVAQDFNDWVRLNPQKTARQFLEERPDAAAQTLVATLVGVGVQAGAIRGVQTLVGGNQENTARAQDAERGAALLTELGAVSSESKYRPRDPQGFDDFVQRAAENGPVQDVYLSAAALQQSGITPDQLALLSPSAAQQMQTALSSGGDIVIPMGEYATTLAGSEVGAALLPHLRTSADGWSQYDAQTYMQSEAENLKAQSEQILAQQATDGVWQASVQAVEDKVMEQMASANRFTRDVNEAYVKGFITPFYNVMAARMGMTPEQMFEAYPLRVTSEINRGPGLDQPAYHGSPHNFDRFSTDNIGTGEGAQAYGWGLYFAENKDIAAGYQKTLGTTDTLLNGAKVWPTDSNFEAAVMIAARGYSEALSNAKRDSTEQFLTAEGRAHAAELALKIEALKKAKIESRQSGALYQVDIPDEAVANMLLWDKPLSEQPEAVQNGLAQIDPETYSPESGDYDANELGQSIYHRVMNMNPTGAKDNGWTSVVNTLNDSAGSPKAASAMLAAAGIPGIKYLDGGSRKDGQGTYNLVVFDDSIITLTHKDGSPVTQAERSEFLQGGQQARGSFNPDTNTIALLKGADLSTFVHETGHFYLEVMNDLANRPDAPPLVQADVKALMDWFGTDLASWIAMSLDQKREMHEKFARGFEAYMFEGKAPNLELQGFFSRFRAWLMNIYKAIQNLNVELTDEVRGVMDRMLATEAQIKEAQAARSFNPLFTSADDAAMTPQQWAEYGEQVQDATQEALDQMLARSLRDMKWLTNARSRELKKLQKSAEEKRKIIEAEVTGEVDAMPLYAARKWLRTGEMIDPITGEQVKAEKGYKLDIAELEAMYPETGLANPDWQSLGKGAAGLTGRNGLAPDLVADMFGFSSGDALVRSLVDGETRDSVIEGMTDQRMLERFGDLNSVEAINRAADVAVHNNLRAKVLATEHDALAKAVGQPRILGKAAKEFAEIIIGRRKIRDIKPNQFTAAESRAARAADKARRANNLATAAIEKRNQIVNNYAARAAWDALDEVDRALAYFERIDGKGARTNRRGEFLVQRDALLARFDLRSSLSLTAIDAQKVPLAEFISKTAEDLSAVVPDLSAEILNEQYRKHYKDMTLEEFRGVVDAVRQLDKLAKREEEQYQAIRNQTFDEERTALLDTLRREHPDAFHEDGDPKGQAPQFVPSLGKGLEKMGDKFVAEFLSAERIISLLEHGKQGPVWESLFGRMSRQSDYKAQRLAQIYKELEPVFKAYSYAERVTFGRTGHSIPQIGTSLTRENMLVVALLNGNQEGRDRLMNYGWGPAQVDAILKNLDARDMALADAIWRMFDDQLWPELKAVNDRTRGKSPPKVEALPYETAHGTARGGYFPLKYDTDLDERAHRFDESQAVQNLLGGSVYGMSAKTNQGTSTERKQNVALRPRLSLAVFAEAVNETVHDVAYREAVADTMRMLNDRKVQNAIKSATGTEAYRALVTRVREVAAPPRNPSGFIENALTIARKNTIVTLMSGVLTAVQNFTGLAPALAKVNTGLLTREVLKFYSPLMVERTRFAMDQSGYLRGRFNNYDRDLQDMTKKLTVNGKILPDTAGFLALMGLVDRAVAVPVWNAAFAEGMAQFDNDQSRAVDHADAVVRMTQGSGREVDLPKIMSGHGGYGQLKRVFTMFYSYFNGQLGLLVETGAIARHEAKENPPAAVARFTAKFIAIIVLPVVLTEWLKDGLKLDDDADKQQRRWVKAFALYGAGMFPVVRDASALVASKLDPDAKHNLQTFRLSPLESAFDAQVKMWPAMADLVRGNGDDKDVKDVIMGLSFGIGLPGKLISDMVLGTKAYLEGRTSNPAAIVIGPPKKQ